MPTIDLPDDELAAVTAAIRGVIEGDRFPHAPRLDPLRAALARLEAGTNVPPDAGKPEGNQGGSGTNVPPPAKADKRARR
jgi:hypothetical protein